MKINCIAVDDSLPAVEKLEGFIRQVPTLNLMKSFTNGIEAITFLGRHTVDLVFLDIQMEVLSGLQFIESLLNRPKIIIVSAYDKYAVKGFDYSVTDYLLKPYSFERFLKSVEKVQTELEIRQPRDYMFVKTEYRMERIDFSDILYIEGQGAYLKIFTIKSKIMTLQNFDNMEKLLPAGDFPRVHKSYIVNLRKIDSIERNRIRIGTEWIPVGPNYRERLNRILKADK